MTGPTILDLPIQKTKQHARSFPQGAEAEARARLSKHPHLRNRRGAVRVHCDGTRLVLTGCLPTYFLKQLAQEAVRNVAGTRIDNQIEVCEEWHVVDKADCEPFQVTLAARAKLPR